MARPRTRSAFVSRAVAVFGVPGSWLRPRARKPLRGWSVLAVASALVVLLGLGSAPVLAAPAPPAATTSLFVTGSLLCRAWQFDGSSWTHCTHYWHRSGSTLISDNPGWVPSSTSVVPSPYVPTWVWQDAQAILGSAGTAPSTDATGAAPASAQTDTQPGTVTDAQVNATDPICQWCYTGIPAQMSPAVVSYQGNPSASVYQVGQCTFWAAYTARPGEDLSWMGDAHLWIASAQARGLPTGTTPRVGATAVFPPNDQGAGDLGHVAHVIAVYGNGWFLVSEMNFSWNGGGFDVVSYRYAQQDGVVRFIY